MKSSARLCSPCSPLLVVSLIGTNALGQTCCVGARDDWSTDLTGLLRGNLLAIACNGSASPSASAATRTLVSVAGRVMNATECESLGCSASGDHSTADSYSGFGASGGTPSITLDVTWNLLGVTPFDLFLDNVNTQTTSALRYRSHTSGWQLEQWSAAGQYQIDSRRVLDEDLWAELDEGGKMIFSLQATRDQMPDGECEGAPSLPSMPPVVLASGTYRFRIAWTDGSGPHSNYVAAFVSIWSDGSVTTLGEAANSTLFNVDSTVGDGSLSVVLDTEEEAPWYRLDLPECGTDIDFDVRFAQGYQPDGNIDGTDGICFTDYKLLAQLVVNFSPTYVDDEYLLSGDLDADGDNDGDDLDVLGNRCSVADFLCDGFVDFFDYDAYVSAFELGSLTADTDGNGFVDFFDYDGYISLFENTEGCGC